MRIRIAILGLVLSATLWGAVAVDARPATSTQGNAVTTLTYTGLTVGAGSNRCLVAYAMYSATPVTSTITWNGTNVPIIGSISSNAAAAGTFVAIFGLVAPASGNNNLVITNGAAVDTILYAMAFTGCDQTGSTTTFSAPAAATGSSTAPSIAISSVVGNWTVACLAEGSGTPSAATQTSDFINTTPNNVNGAGSDGTGASTVTHTWTLSPTSTWTVVGTSIAASGAAAVVHSLSLLGVGK